MKFKLTLNLSVISLPESLLAFFFKLPVLSVTYLLSSYFSLNNMTYTAHYVIRKKKNYFIKMCMHSKAIPEKIFLEKAVLIQCLHFRC